MARDFEIEAENPMTGQKTSGLMGIGSTVVNYVLGIFVLIMSASIAFYAWGRSKAFAGVDNDENATIRVN